MMRQRIYLAVLALVVLLASCGRIAAVPAPTATALAADSTTDAGSFVQFEEELEALRQKLNIPGFSAAIVQDQELVWARGFGYANVEKGIEATPDTPYHIASVTKPLAATIVMQLVEEGKLDLEDPVSDYGVSFESQGVIRVKHLLSHTSEGVPGAQHNYNGYRYGLLAKAVQGATGKSFGRLLGERILAPLNMAHSAPRPAWGWGTLEAFWATLGLGEGYRQFPRVYRELAKPYQFDASYENVTGMHYLHFNAGAGLISSVTDLARFDIALDRNRLVRPETRERLFAPFVSNTGEELTYGLGWYTQQYKGTRLVWHSGGEPPSVSALLLKVPDEDLTFIILANNDNLNRPYPFGSGDVLYCTPALAFYRRFVFPRQFGKPVPEIEWEAEEDELVSQLAQVTDRDVRDVLERELLSYRKLHASVGRMDLVDRLWAVHRRAFSGSSLGREATATWAEPVTPQPVPRTPGPASVLVLSWLLLAWFPVAIGIAIWLVVDFARGSALPRPCRTAWLLATLFWGPLSLLAYLVSDRRIGRSASQCAGMSSWRRALGPSLYGVVGNVIGLTLVLELNYHFLRAPRPVLILALTLASYLVGWLVFRAALRATTLREKYSVSLCRTALVELASTVLVLAGLFSALVLIPTWWFRGFTENSPFFALFVLAGAVLGALLVYPLHVWLVRRGI